MATILQQVSDVLHSYIDHMQTVHISEVRQAVELLSVQHTEVLVALVIFLLFQFTKFTAVLLLAFGIASGIFYMWDTWFPEIRNNIPKPASAPIQPADSDPSDGPDPGPGPGPSAGPGPEPAPSPSKSSPYEVRDQRTSATLPPFTKDGDKEMLQNDPGYIMVQSRTATSAANTPTTSARTSLQRMRRKSADGTAAVSRRSVDDRRTQRSVDENPSLPTGEATPIPRRHSNTTEAPAPAYTHPFSGPIDAAAARRLSAHLNEQKVRRLNAQQNEQKSRRATQDDTQAPRRHSDPTNEQRPRRSSAQSDPQSSRRSVDRRTLPSADEQKSTKSRRTTSSRSSRRQISDSYEYVETGFHSAESRIRRSRATPTTMSSSNWTSTRYNSSINPSTRTANNRGLSSEEKLAGSRKSRRTGHKSKTNYEVA